jgi:glycosyltransferase involved in cell wall biosynthesis
MKKCILFLFHWSSFAFGKRISIIIPCHYKHAQYLENLLHLYEQQTLTPDEVVISFSGSDDNNPFIIRIKQQVWRFYVNILISKAPLTAGQNRNRACSSATGDILIC